MSNRNRLICVDWGTTNFRAFLVDADTGTCLDDRQSDQGLLKTDAGTFAQYCDAQIGDWRDGGRVPVYLAGMVGSDRGWITTPQLELPLSPQQLADHRVAAPGMENAWILPGAKMVTECRVDVMRGEEIQIIGALAHFNQSSGVCCLPGTHSKWSLVTDSNLSEFATSMTGELYQLLMQYSFIAGPAEKLDGFNTDAFQLGLTRSKQGHGLLQTLFEARSRFLYADLKPKQIADFISGVIIGEEVRNMCQQLALPEQVILVCSDRLRAPYSQAFASFGLQARWLSSAEATITGMLTIHRQ
jgi:2-dehydro-3-deoxygalactonokinase